jgi:hypothetical protein
MRGEERRGDTVTAYTHRCPMIGYPAWDRDWGLLDNDKVCP